jgi:hypothetical protein
MKLSEYSTDENAWSCGCPSFTTAKPGEPCKCSGSKTALLEMCVRSCSEDVNDCIDDKVDSYVHAHGVLSQGASEKIDKQCNNKYKGCYKECGPGEKLLEKFFIHAEDGNVEEFKKGLDYIVKNDWGVNYVGDDGMTPINIAAKNGHLAIVKLLVEAGAFVWIEDHHGTAAWYMYPDNQGMTPIDHARENGHDDIVEYLSTLPPSQG